MSETTPTCQIHKKHSRIDCQNPARPGDADGFCILHSQDKEKNPDDFKAALRARWQQEDQESYDFRGVFFPGPFVPYEVFGSREFNKPVDFSWATFTEEAIFSGAPFKKEDLVIRNFGFQKWRAGVARHIRWAVTTLHQHRRDAGATGIIR